MEKVDFKKMLKHLYLPSAKHFAVADVPEMQFLMIDGQGDPNTALAYHQALEALYAVSYGLKFMSKRELARDYTVMALEGLWWTPDMAGFSMEDKGAWHWTMMMMQPDWITGDMAQAAVAEAGGKKDLPALARMRFEPYHEGLSVQIMHIGPYDAEGPTIARMHQFIAENGYQPAGKHHEIYLGDPRRTAPEKLKTVLRQPVRPA
jgi:hypothetical protein